MHRTKFFLVLISLWVIPLVSYRVIWLLQSKRATGLFAFQSYGPALDQIRFPYSVIYFKVGKDTIFFKAPPHLRLSKNAVVTVLYQPRNPEDARLDSFKAIWSGTIIYGGIPLLFLIVIFLHPEIIPYRSKVELRAKSPFVRVV
jgi:hypothetical protein